MKWVLELKDSSRECALNVLFIGEWFALTSSEFLMF